jgi:hypothetical protein
VLFRLTSHLPERQKVRRDYQRSFGGLSRRPNLTSHAALWFPLTPTRWNVHSAKETVSSDKVDPPEGGDRIVNLIACSHFGFQLVGGIKRIGGKSAK